MLKVKRLHPDAKLPTRGHPTDAGLDLYALEDVIVSPCQSYETREVEYLDGDTIVRTTILDPADPPAKVRTGLAFAIPEDWVGSIRDRSSMASRGIISAGGVVDPGYTGEVVIMLHNLSTRPVAIRAGDKAAQLLVIPCPVRDVIEDVTEVDDLPASQRGDKGFGSTGR